MVEGCLVPLQVRFAKERNKPPTDTTSLTSGLQAYFDPSTQQYVYWPGTGTLDPTSLLSSLGPPPEGYTYAIAGTDGSMTPATYPYFFGSSSSLTSGSYPYYPTNDGTNGLVAPPGYQFATIGADGSLTPVGATPQPGSFSLFVLHLPPHYRDDHLNNLFKDYGTVVTAKVMMDSSTGQSKGYGFVNMSTYMESQAAIAGLNGYHVPNTNKYLKVSFKTAGPGAKKDNPFG